jgi:hypothetical protein
MTYVVEITAGGRVYIPSFMKIVSAIQVILMLLLQ